jgi:hypothetical protein
MNFVPCILEWNNILTVGSTRRVPSNIMGACYAAPAAGVYKKPC